MGIRESVFSWRRGLIDLVWPSQCPVCEAWLGEAASSRGEGEGFAFSRVIHRECLESLSSSGHALDGPSNAPASCPVAWRYRDDSRFFRILHAIKYGGQYPLIEVLCDSFAAWAAPLLPPVSAGRILPLPEDPLRLARRGYSLPRALAATLARTTNLPLVEGILIRRKAAQGLATLAQKSEREAALESVFGVSRLAELPSDLPLFLVDDQVTTGATLAACVPLLRSRGHPLLALALAGAKAAPRRV